MIEIFETGKVPSGYVPIRDNLPDTGGLKGIMVADGELQIVTQKFPTIRQVIEARKAGKDAYNEFRVSFPSEDEARQYLIAGAEFIGAQGLEIITLVQGSKLPCLKGKMVCSTHLNSKQFITCKEQANPNCWYGLAKPYVKAE